jgi:hypothetical protein
LVFQLLKLQFLLFIPNSIALGLRLTIEPRKYQAMKNRIFGLLAALLLLSACNKDDENTQPLALEGTWNLKEVSCECKPTNLQAGEHIWGFDPEAALVNIQSTVDGDTLSYVPDPGSYTFIQNTVDKTVTIEDIVFSGGAPSTITFDYAFEDGDLILSDDPEADGPWMRFVR